MTTANASERPSTPREGLLVRHPLIFYFLMAYAGTWLITVPLALSTNGVGLLPLGIPNGSVIFVSAVWVFLGPTLAAFIVTGATEGRAYAACCVGTCCGGSASGGTWSFFSVLLRSYCSP